MKYLKVILCLFLIFSLTSCYHKKLEWDYKINSYKNFSKDYDVYDFSEATLLIPRFVDDRFNKNKNHFWRHIIPIYPYGEQNLQFPGHVSFHSNSSRWDVDFPRNFSNSLREEILSLNLFKEVKDYDKNANYAIYGRIISTDYHGRIYSYGLSVSGYILWFLGLPMSKTSNNLQLELSLVDLTERVDLYHKIFDLTAYKKSTIYSSKSDFNYSLLLKKIYKDFITEAIFRSKNLIKKRCFIKETVDNKSCKAPN